MISVTEKTKNKRKENMMEETTIIKDNSNKKFCASCGSEIHEEAIVCPVCGASQQVNSQETATGIKKFIKRFKTDKKLWVISAGALIVIIALAFIIFYPTKLERVQDECLHIAGIIGTEKNGFSIDTKPYPNESANTSSLQTRALQAIKHANEELGFDSSVYTRMINTTFLMGRQTAENDKYKVSWTYHPDDGLEVTYQKK